MKHEKNATIEPYPRMRQLTIDGGWINSRRHNIHGLLEMDVTNARRIIAAHKQQTGETISFTAFMLACLARAVRDNPRMHAYRDWRGRLVMFHDVNVNTMFQADVDGRQTVLPHIVKAADKKNVRQIHDEIRAVQQQHTTSRNSDEARYIKRFVALPAFVRRIFYWYIYRNPYFLHERFGTVSLTAVGMFGKGGGWGIAFGNNTLCVTLGGIAEKPGVVDGRIAIRDYLSITLTMDHDIIDGAPAARFAQQFKDLVETAHTLRDIGPAH
jgi:pyruvate/2-oxoglutarate dehydrogenase complex dihydrolipoamide acyltransferase (E2) component